MIIGLVLLIGLALAFANGANDNFKGVATLFGSGTTDYRRALVFATVTTALGSLTALLVARGLLAAFSGKGLVPAEVLANPEFPLAVALAASATVLLATRFGFPVSTTHALIGGLLGAAWVASPAGVNLDQLVDGFLLPLLSSPLLAVAAAVVLYPLFRFARRRLGVEQETCVCIGTEELAVVPGVHDVQSALRMIEAPTLSVGDRATCHVRYRGRLAGTNARSVLDVAHYLSAGSVGFARGLNDTPKIAALLLVGGAVTPNVGIIGTAVVMAAGGWIAARRVAETMSHGVTRLNPGQGFTANLVTASLVIGASRFGLPVSTTHVSCGALFGIGAVTREANWRAIRQILLAWVITLPLAGAIAAGAYVLLF